MSAKPIVALPFASVRADLRNPTFRAYCALQPLSKPLLTMQNNNGYYIQVSQSYFTGKHGSDAQ
jgi:hypothetical protein